MKKILITSFVFLFVILFLQCRQKAPQTTGQTTPTASTTYDSLLAQRLGADEIGMRQYVMAFLKA